METKRPRCKRCGATNTYIRSKTNERVCKICGLVDKVDKVGET